MDSSIGISHRRVMSIALPIVLSNISIPILGAIDTGVIGQLGNAVAIGAVGIGAIILSAVYWLFGFLRMGTTGFVAQAYGRDDTSEVVALLVRGLLIGLACGFFVILIHPILFWLSFLISPSSAEVELLALDYMSIRIFSAPAIIATYAIMGWLIALEKTKYVLILQLAMNGLNAALDFWFVLGMGWGVEGVAWATFIAEWFAFFMGLGICCALSQNFPKIDWSLIFSKTKVIAILVVNRDIFLRSFMLEIIFVSFLMTSGKFGDVELAATQILLQFLHISAYGMDGFAFAAEVLVGQAFGKTNRSMLRDAVVKSGVWTFTIAVFMAVTYAFLGGFFIAIMTTSNEVRLVSENFLIFIVLGPIFGALPFLMDGIFVGATRSVDMRNMMFLSLIIYALSAYILINLYGFYGLWVALLVSYAARGISLLTKYPRLESSII